MSNIVVNAIVRIGGGKVEYRVDNIENGKAFVIGEKSSRTVEVSKLMLVSLPVTQSVEESTEEVSLFVSPTSLTQGVFLVTDDYVQSFGSFDSAAFALSRRKGQYKAAAIVVDNVVKVTR